MKTKKLLLIGALALVVIGCVLAAGCTSTTTTTQTSVSDDILVGTWTCTDDEGVHIIVTKNDGTGFVTTIAKEDGTRILRHSKFTWTKNADGTITHTLEKETSPIIQTYNAEKDLFTDTRGNTLTRLDPITGIWYNEGTLGGKNTKFSNIFKPDGTGVLGAELDDGTTKVIESTWKKNADGTYTTTYADGFTNTLKLDDTKNILSTATATNRTLTKKFADSSYYMSILGPWYNEKNQALTFFNADGTYTIIVNKETIGEGTWEDIPGFGKFALHVNVGTASGENISGMDRVWTYDRVNNTITAQTGSEYVRPSGAVGDLTYVKFN